SLKKRFADAKVAVIEKEAEPAAHASGRNSGVLHAGFYYTEDSLKAKFSVAGNRILKSYCKEKGLPINESGKLVVAMNETELATLCELERRGIKNGANVRLISKEEAEEIDPNVATFSKALYSPDTATIDPQAICIKLKEDLKRLGVVFFFSCRYLGYKEKTITTTQGEIGCGKLVNAAGLYADSIAHGLGFGEAYTIIPFKGLYLKYEKNTTDIRTNIYPVPNLKNPFLGVHFTITVDGHIKIGPTAIPCFWREQYDRSSRFRVDEMAEILFWEARLFFSNSFGFRSLAFEEMRKYSRSYLISLAAQLVKSLDPNGFGRFTKPGIRAQLLNKKNSSLVQDFVVEADDQSVHILNAVSPAFTCCFPFADYVVDKYVSC
ncbi:MAG: FAD-dependent oxidoreductase, partial [SAR324 cluster bacterium]|nr:FAD-dependent oxidoreductase [SAR324 cluster bacterium]